MYKSAAFAKFRDVSQIARNDTRSEIIVRLLDRNGTPLQLSGRPVTWSGVQNGRQVIAPRAAAVYANGQVGVRLQAADALKKGPLYLQFEISWPDGTKERLPSSGKLFLLLT